MPFRLRSRSGGKKLLPVLQLFRRQAGAMNRGQRRKVAQVDGNGCEQNRRARALSVADDVIQVGGQAGVNAIQPRIVVRHLPAKKELEAFPLLWLACAAGDLRQPLADARRFQCENRSHGRKARGLPAKDCSSAERADDFVVTRVNQPEISLARGAVLRDQADDVRVDRRHRRVDDLDFLVRMTRLEKTLKLSGETISRLRIAHGRGPAEDKNPHGIRRLARGQIQRSRRAGDSGREEPPAEPGIVPEHDAARIFRF